MGRRPEGRNSCVSPTARPGNHPGVKRIPHPLVIAVLGVAVGAIFGYLAVDTWRENRALATRGEETVARVVDVRDRIWPRAPRVRVEFTTAGGRTRQTWINGDRGADRGVGDEVRVRYDPDNAGNTVRADSDGPNYLLFAVLSVVFLLGGPALAWFGIRPARRALAENPELAERVARRVAEAEGR